jgi:hypothetical protein
MAAKLTRLTHKIEIQLRLVTESCTICSSSSRRTVRKLLDIPRMSRHCIRIYPRELRKTRKAGAPAEMQTGYLQNKSKKRSRLK